ncbi:MAG: hypothetical protein A2W80_01575 [Candidatus Riflebacteria bacterium GWC2_50_8]|nr:MAG: hypothetical protein A2W80_01575 [Candidatus Riflebacteria bacterium GWC2_50_8]
MKRKASLFIAVAVFALAIGIQFTFAADEPSDKEWKKFEGAWFEILYPADFRVEPSLKGVTSVEGHDSVFFVSPSDEVAFYVFSPQWSGDPSDILLNQETEKQLTLEDSNKDGKQVRQCTIEAKDGSYCRTYEDVQDPQINTRRVFGIRYKDQKTLDQYKEQYKRFQDSLAQFAD